MIGPKNTAHVSLEKKKERKKVVNMEREKTLFLCIEKDIFFVNVEWEKALLMWSGKKLCQCGEGKSFVNVEWEKTLLMWSGKKLC